MLVWPKQSIWLQQHTWFIMLHSSSGSKGGDSGRLLFYYAFFPPKYNRHLWGGITGIMGRLIYRPLSFTSNLEIPLKIQN